MRTAMVYLALLAVLTAGPLLLRQSNPQSAGPAETLVIVTPHPQDVRNEFAWAFSDWHQRHFGTPVDLQYQSVGGTNDIQRQLETVFRLVRANHGGTLPPEDQMHVGIDMVWGGGDFLFDQGLKPLGILRPIPIDPNLLHEVFPSPTIAGVRMYDKDTPPKWIGVCLSSFGIVYNPDLCAAMHVPPPTSWSDLADPRLCGAVALADPTHSGSAAVAYLMVLQRSMADAETAYLADPTHHPGTPGYEQALDAGWLRGQQTLLRIAANARYFVDGATQVPNDVASGDAAAGVAIDFYGRVTEQTVGPNRERFIVRPGTTATTSDPVGIIYGTTGRRLQLATHFVEFLLSREGQELWIKKPGTPGGPRDRALCRAPIRADLYADRTDWAENVDPFADAAQFNQRGQWMGSFAELRMIWAAAWVDDADDLHAAWQAAIHSPDPAQAIDLLCDLPITRQQVSALTAQRKQTQDLDRWVAQQRLDWAQRFRAHYRQVVKELPQ